MSDESYVKILFRFFSNALEKETVETLWASAVDVEKGHYKIDNIPFYVPSLAPDDIVYAKYDAKEGMLTYQETIEFSGKSVVQVVIMDDTEINMVRDIFREMGCDSERFGDKYFAMEIPAEIDYSSVKLKLDELESKGVLDYAEPCLSHKHRY